MLLLLIFKQDVKDRMVWVWAFPLLAVALAWLNYREQHIYDFRQLAVNLIFLFVQLGLVSLYFSIKNKTWTNITSELLGWGDILFLCALAFYLPVVNFIVFYLSSLLLILLYWVLRKPNNRHIPLAGLQALLFALLLCSGWLVPALNLQQTDWILKLMA
ncbi:hypothetical protein C8P68_11256 [Mucilaginibacter yixingensis]|uniref:Type IV leader peptidase family protein n=2 Tax=Mucilaginibacter yixingensis TaxID=1295612 RepID=A0A2T5J4L8_9SPHI|nr:hypothetical protein C8P68_11256 [Mucilaginibacter yixingensis]